MPKRLATTTIKDVAKEAGVGLMTVSRVINDVPGKKFSEATAARVREAIKRLGYEPNRVARSLRGQRSGVIGFVTTNVTDPFWAKCARGVELEVRKENYVAILVASDEDCLLEEHQVGALQGRRVDGLLLAATPRLKRTTLIARIANLPTVAIDRPIVGVKTDCVLIDNRKAAANATRHLIEHGHRRIAFAGYGDRIYTVKERMEGYLDAMREAGLAPRVCAANADPEAAAINVREILSAPDRPSGLFAMNTMTMHGIFRATTALHLSIPEDLAVTGFEDFDWAGFVRPGLTVIRQPGEEMGRMAAQLLFERLAGKEDPPRQVMLEAELIVRESCGCRTAECVVSP